MKIQSDISCAKILIIKIPILQMAENRLALGSMRY
jgi:hypothetical protein